MAYREIREYPSGFPLSAKVFENASCLSHWHSDIELILVREGSIGVGINSEYKVLEKGDIALCSSGDIHYYDSKDRKSTVLIIVFRPEILGNVINMPSDTKADITFLDSSTAIKISLDKAINIKIRHCINSVYQEMIEQQKDYQTFIKAHILELFGLFSRYIPKIVQNRIVSPGRPEASSAGHQIHRQQLYARTYSWRDF